jgi:muramoyltetrapeptide carboxypeptidase LdcA involved in peptidoglycan recycling
LGLKTAQAPPRVRPGQTVAVVAPSFGAVGAWQHRAERGRAYIESLGLKVKLMPNATRNDTWVSAPAQARADDIHTAFADTNVSVVLAAIGGNHSNQLLPLLDFALIQKNPKIFQGYSDNTVLHWAFVEHADLRTFYGPAFTLALAEYPEVLPYTDRHLRAAWFGADPITFEAAPQWTEEILDFDRQVDLTRPRRLMRNEGWVTLHDGVAQGPLIGGCLETICWHLKGRDEWPDLKGALLMLETSEEAPSPAHVDGYLTDLAHLGTFDDIVGLIVARPAFYGPEDTESLWQVVTEYTGALPVLANVDCGHTDPMLTVPLGARVRLDAGGRTFATLEPATAAGPSASYRAGQPTGEGIRPLPA